MRHIIYSLACFLCFSAYSQKNLSNALKSRIQNNSLPSANFDVLIQGDIQKLIASEKTLGIKVKYYANNIACVNANVNAIGILIENKTAKYIEYIEPNKKPLNDTMQIRNRIRPVKLGTTPLTAAYDGTGMIVGIIDSGCDFNHPDFKDALGNTRINFIWDQAIATPTTIPMPFGYGQEWTAAQINGGFCTHDDTPYYGHGTGVTGIAAGNGKASLSHEGIASKAEIIVVALDFNRPGPVIADAVQYIITKATAAGKPFVINASVGDYYGSHDGTDSEAKLIDGLISNIPGRAMVVAAGNGGNVKFHTQNIPTPTDTNFTWIYRSSGNLYYWLYADTNNIKNVKYSIGSNRLNFDDLGDIGFKNYNYCFTLKKDTIKVGSNRIGIIESSASVNPYGVYELFVKIIPDSAGYLWRIESKGTGKFDAWNFDFATAGLPTVSQYPKITKYTMPDTIQSICSGFQCSDDIISVANYINLKQYWDVNNTLQTIPETCGELSDNSSAGPTRDGRVKPEVAASGGAIFTCLIVSQMASLIASNPLAVAQGSYHIASGGTSASSPVVAGLATLFMQAHPAYTNKQIRQAIINCTYSDVFTGSSLPNYKWGYGKLDGFSTFTCALVAGVDNTKSSFKEGNVYPNPFDHQTTIKLKQTINGDINVYNAMGALIFTDKINSDQYILNRSVINAAGVYFVVVKSSNTEYNYKVIATD